MQRSETTDATSRLRMTVCIGFGLLLWASCGAPVRGARTDSLEEKLGTITDYVPKALAPVDQLVEVARRFNIPMGIEWVERASIAPPEQTLPSGKRSVRNLIEEIARVSPEHRVVVDDGLVRIYSLTGSVHPFNFLNIRLKSYIVKEADIFAAENELRWAIRFTLEPKKYLHGYNGGYGHGANDILQIPKLTLSESNVTIREVLNRIALAHGNALWVATIKSEDLEGDEPCWRRKGGDDGDCLVTAAWHFFPLAEITELATERVAIDVVIEGLLDERLTTVPVMLEHGLAGDSGGSIGGSSSEGSYQYRASLEKPGNDFVKLSVHLKVGRTGEAEFTFEKKLEVYKARITEIRPESRIIIRAYFEDAAKP
jgi:hypothetical protein